MEESGIRSKIDNNDIIDIEKDRKKHINSFTFLVFININKLPSTVDKPANKDKIKGPIISIVIIKLYTLIL